MPAKNAEGKLPSPWKEFLAELNRMLKEPLELHCIGGFVLVYFYGFPRTTADIDYFSAVPANLNLDEVAGQGSALHKEHGVWAVANLPEEYGTRLQEMAPGKFKPSASSYICGWVSPELVTTWLLLGYRACKRLVVDPENPYGLRGYFGPHMKCFPRGHQWLSLDNLSHAGWKMLQFLDELHLRHLVPMIKQKYELTFWAFHLT
jgi:hypothetical protein